MTKKKAKPIMPAKVVVSNITDPAIIMAITNIDPECPNYIPIVKSRDLDLKENKKMYY